MQKYISLYFNKKIIIFPTPPLLSYGKLAFFSFFLLIFLSDGKKRKKAVAGPCRDLALPDALSTERVSKCNPASVTPREGNSYF